MSEIYKDLDKLYEKIEKIENENKRLHSIIKEVREYIEKYNSIYGYYFDKNAKRENDYLDVKEELLEILDKENMK